MRLVMDKKALLYPKWINQNTYCLLILSLKIKAKAKIKIILWNLEWHFLFLGIKLLPPYPPSHSRSPTVTFKNNAYLTSWHCHLHLHQKVATSCLCVFFFFKLLLLTSGLVLRIWQIVLNSGYCSCYSHFLPFKHYFEVKETSCFYFNTPILLQMGEGNWIIWE